MKAKEAIDKIRSLLGIKLAEETVEEKVETVEEKPAETVEEKVEEVVEEKPTEKTAEERIAELEKEFEDMKTKFDEMQRMVTEIIDRDNKAKEEIKEEVREEVVEQFAKTNPTAQPVHVQQNAVEHKMTAAERIAQLRKEAKK